MIHALVDQILETAEHRYHVGTLKTSRQALIDARFSEQKFRELLRQSDSWRVRYLIYLTLMFAYLEHVCDCLTRGTKPDPMPPFYLIRSEEIEQAGLDDSYDALVATISDLHHNAELQALRLEKAQSEYSHLREKSDSDQEVIAQLRRQNNLYIDVIRSLITLLSEHGIAPTIPIPGTIGETALPDPLRVAVLNVIPNEAYADIAIARCKNVKETKHFIALIQYLVDEHVVSLEDASKEYFLEPLIAYLPKGKRRISRSVSNLSERIKNEVHAPEEEAED